MSEYTIGQAARAAGVNVETLRYYERRGLMPEPPRSRGNYRLYPEDSVRIVRFVKRAQELGFTLNEIRELLTLRSGGDEVRCADVRAQASLKLRDIERKIRSLQTIRKALSQLVTQCSGSGPVAACPILEALEPENGE
ncbi:MAG: MerR family transcriptional regulator [Acidobacteria bacterium]|nr:MerR family transcriptional regulator [Acidobacteriota bacterium]